MRLSTFCGLRRDQEQLLVSFWRHCLIYGNSTLVGIGCHTLWTFMSFSISTEYPVSTVNSEENFASLCALSATLCRHCLPFSVSTACSFPPPLRILWALPLCVNPICSFCTVYTVSTVYHSLWAWSATSCGHCRPSGHSLPGHCLPLYVGTVFSEGAVCHSL
jgi:hypothetical protein